MDYRTVGDQHYSSRLASEHPVEWIKVVSEITRSRSIVQDVHVYRHSSTGIYKITHYSLTRHQAGPRLGCPLLMYKKGRISCDNLLHSTTPPPINAEASASG
jgi:hypothetical protein